MLLSLAAPLGRMSNSCYNECQNELIHAVIFLYTSLDGLNISTYTFHDQLG